MTNRIKGMSKSYETSNEFLDVLWYGKITKISHLVKDGIPSVYIYSILVDGIWKIFDLREFIISTISDYTYEELSENGLKIVQKIINNK